MKGPKNYRNEAFPLVNEFFQRKALAKLGFHGGSTADLAWERAQRLMEVGNEIERCRAEEMKRNRKRG